MTSENLWELSLALLDDAASADSSQQLEKFAHSERWVEDSIFAEANLPEKTLNVQSPARAEPEHIVFANSLTQRYSRQKLQNEALIKALQELRERMNDSKQQNVKAVP